MQVDPRNISKRCSACGPPIATTGRVKRFRLRSAGTRTTPTTTPRRTSICSISVVGKMQPTEAHP
nr:hypothetical protein [Halobellus rufus]